MKSYNIVALSFEMSQRCNLRCSYCYLGDRKNAHTDMSEDVASKAIDMFYSIFDRKRAVEIFFFGGEPLLNFVIIKFIINKLNGISRVDPVKFNFTVITNGVFLDKEKLSFFSKENVTIQISLDGNREQHDFCRKNMFGRGSYDSIMHNLDKVKFLKKNGIHNKIVVRGTLTKKSIPITGIIEHFDQLGIRDYLYIPADSLVSDDTVKLDKEQVKEQVILQIADFKNRILRKDRISDLLILNCFKIIHAKIKIIYPCGSCRTLIGIGADGSLFPCHRYFNGKEFIIGDVYRGINKEKIDRLTPIHVEEKNICSNCIIRYLCGGTCSYTSHFFKDLQYTDEQYCMLYITIYTELIKLTINLSKNHREIYSNFIEKIKKESEQQNGLIIEEFPFKEINLYTDCNYMSNMSIFVKSNSVTFIDLDSEGILSRDNNKYIVNTTSMALWDLIDGQRTAQQIAQEIASVCEVDVEAIKDDIYGQLAAFQELGLAEEVPAASHA